MNPIPEAPRHEAAAKLSGAAHYSADPAFERLLHAALVPAPLAHGEIDAIDADAARAMPGVVAVLTHEHLGAPRDAGVLRLLAGTRVDYLGQAVAIVVAESAGLARAAAARVRVAMTPLPLVANLAQAGDAIRVPPSAGRVPADSARGDAEAAVAGPGLRLDAQYRTSANVHQPMEPHVGTAQWGRDANGDETLSLHVATQAVFATRRALAYTLGLPRERVRLVCPLLGGGFGSKGQAWWPLTVLLAQAARGLGRPLRLELSRAEMFTQVGRRSPTVQRLRVAADDDGRLAGIVHDALGETWPYSDFLDATCSATRMLYACPNVLTRHRVVRVHAPQSYPMRAPGHGPGEFALESALDEVAVALGLDPLALRERNFAGHDPQSGLPWSSNGLRECWRTGARAFGWADRPKRGTGRDGRWLTGCGMASVTYPYYRQASEAIVGRDADGGTFVRCATQDMGSGALTAIARIAAQALGCEPARVRVEIGDADAPEGPPSAGSMATASYAPAVEAAARALRARLDAGEAPTPGAPLEAHARSEPEADPSYSAHAFGAVFAEVRVDPLTGETRVARITAAYEAGRILDAAMARSQYVGGLVGGIGMALTEASITDPATGRIVNDDLAGYRVPVHADMPAFDIHCIDAHDPFLAGGHKGIGMLGTCGTAAAIANAVFDATGVRVRELPIRPEHLLRDD